MTEGEAEAHENAATDWSVETLGLGERFALLIRRNQIGELEHDDALAIMFRLGQVIGYKEVNESQRVTIAKLEDHVARLEVIVRAWRTKSG